MRGSRYKRRRKRLRRFIVLGILACLLVLFFSMESKLGPVIRAAAKAQAASVSTQALHKAAAAVIADSGDTYNQLLQINRDGDGRVTSVSTDAMGINRLKSQLSLSMQDALAGLDRQTIKIPLGNITGNSFLFGRGPSVRLRFLPVTALTTDFESNFSDAGINQTRHQIYLRVRAGMQVTAAGYKTPFSVETRFLIAESVIVGVVPDAYTEVIEDSGLVGDLMDFGAVLD